MDMNVTEGRTGAVREVAEFAMSAPCTNETRVRLLEMLNDLWDKAFWAGANHGSSWKVEALRDVVSKIYGTMPQGEPLKCDDADKVANACSMVLALTAPCEEVER